MAGGRTRPTLYGVAAIGIGVFVASSAVVRLATAGSDEVMPELRWLLLGVLLGEVLVGCGLLCDEIAPAWLSPWLFLLVLVGVFTGTALLPEPSMREGFILGTLLAWFPHCWHVVGVRYA